MVNGFGTGGLIRTPLTGTPEPFSTAASIFGR